MLELKNLSFSAPEGKEIIENLNLTVSDGKTIVITGPNGSGKSTLAKLIAGVYQPDEGQIFLDGEDITTLDITERARRGISFGFQRPVCFKGFTVRDLLEVAAGHALSETEIKVLLGQVGLCMQDYAARELNSSLSGGEQKRIEIAGILARNTRLNLFDEPEAGIDIWSFQKLIDVFRTLGKNRHAAQIIISHQKGIMTIADEVLILCGGRIVNRGRPDELLPHLFGKNVESCPVGRRCH